MLLCLAVDCALYIYIYLFIVNCGEFDTEKRDKRCRTANRECQGSTTGIQTTERGDEGDERRQDNASV